MFLSRFMPCTDCGASVDRHAGTEHACDRERLLDYRMFGLREEIAALETRVAGFLASPTGLFEQWLAARKVRRSGTA